MEAVCISAMGAARLSSAMSSEVDIPPRPTKISGLFSDFAVSTFASEAFKGVAPTGPHPMPTTPVLATVWKGGSVNCERSAVI
jgi:hypothetical protein